MNTTQPIRIVARWLVILLAAVSSLLVWASATSSLFAAESNWIAASKTRLVNSQTGGVISQTADDVAKAVCKVTERGTGGTTTGWIVWSTTDYAVVITNAHLIDRHGEQNREQYTVSHQGVNYDALRLLYYRGKTPDLAAFAIRTKRSLRYAIVADQDVSAGDYVQTIGYFRGSPKISFSDGRVARNRGVDSECDTSQESGQSGSPVIGADGRVVGVAHSKMTMQGPGPAVFCNVRPLLTFLAKLVDLGHLPNQIESRSTQFARRLLQPRGYSPNPLPLPGRQREPQGGVQYRNDQPVGSTRPVGFGLDANVGRIGLGLGAGVYNPQCPNGLCPQPVQRQALPPVNQGPIYVNPQPAPIYSQPNPLVQPQVNRPPVIISDRPADPVRVEVFTVPGERGPAGRNGIDGVNGKDADMDAVRRMIEQAIESSPRGLTQQEVAAIATQAVQQVMPQVIDQLPGITLDFEGAGGTIAKSLTAKLGENIRVPPIVVSVRTPKGTQVQTKPLSAARFQFNLVPPDLQLDGAAAKR